MRRLASVFGFTCFIAASPAFAQDEPAPTLPPPAPQPAAVAPPAAPAAPAPPAATEPPKVEEEKPKDRSAYVSFSPIHLLFPIVELTAEFRVHEKIGLAAIAGFGSIDPQQFDSTRNPNLKTSRFSVWELGGQFVSYPVGHFDHGMQLGAEILYLGVAGSATDAADTRTRATGTGQGLAMGPFVGYKLSTSVGFSFKIQGGVQYVTARAEATATNQTERASASESSSSVIPLLNINVGWAF